MKVCGWDGREWLGAAMRRGLGGSLLTLLCLQTTGYGATPTRTLRTSQENVGARAGGPQAMALTHIHGRDSCGAALGAL